MFNAQYGTSVGDHKDTLSKNRKEMERRISRMSCSGDWEKRQKR